MWKYFFVSFSRKYKTTVNSGVIWMKDDVLKIKQ